jgi:hypothetical protein
VIKVYIFLPANIENLTNIIPMVILNGHYTESTHREIKLAGHWWLKSAILATHEAEIRRFMAQSQSRQNIHKTLSQKNPTQKTGWRIGSSG